MNKKKKSLGQYFTKSNVWMKEHVIEFIQECPIRKVVDPFAGGGDLLSACSHRLGITDTLGLDIDKSLGWEVNDSLKSIPNTGRLVVTNPPYLHKSRATKLELSSTEYFISSEYTDLYQIALDRILSSHNYVVAIIPESFITSGLFRERLHSITVLLDNPFKDTEHPVCVCCWGTKAVRTKVYKDDTYVDYFENLLKIEKKPNFCIDMKLNDRTGQIGLCAIDGSTDYIKFCKPSELINHIESVKEGAKAFTIVNVKEIPDHKAIDNIIEKSNSILQQYRHDTKDLLLCPFKGNNRLGIRRRRLNFSTARAILEEAILKTKT